MEALWGFLGTIIGAGVSIVTSLISNRHEIIRQQRADSLERIERARIFQRENLLEVQQTIQDMMRYYFCMLHEDRIAFMQSGEWGKVRLSEEVNEGSRATNAKLAMLRVRIADDEVREAIKSLVSRIVKYHVAKTEEEADAIMDEASDSFTPLMERIGETLRSLY
jgi:hypothetical protein